MVATYIVQAIVSILTVISWWLMGDKRISGPIMGVVCQMAWTFYAVMSHQWLILPSVLFLGIVSVRNWIKWAKETNTHQ